MGVARKTHCRRGHPYVIDQRGRQLCRQCKKKTDAIKYSRDAILARQRNRRWLVAHPGAERRARLKRLYDLTPEQFDAMMVRQGGVCAICNKPPKPGRFLHVEHCHDTERVRGLCCWVCNRHRLGRARDKDAPLYEKIAAYLRSDFDGRLL